MKQNYLCLKLNGGKGCFHQVSSWRAVLPHLQSCVHWYLFVCLLAQIASCFTDCSSNRQCMQVVFFTTFTSMLFVD